MSTTFKRWGQSELLPRYIFAESIIAHQRILEIGAVASTEGMSAYFLLIRGARTVVACDSALEATQKAQTKLGAPNLTFRPMVFEGLSPASFDLIAITDLAPFIRAPTFFDQLLRLLTPRGYVLGGLRNAAGLALSQVMEADAEDPPPSYGQLRDLLDSRFSSIQVATQAPVLGYQLAFEEGEGLQIEGSLTNAGEAAYYVVIAGAEPRKRIEPLWVQLSPEPLAFNRDRLEEAALRARKWQIRFEEQKETFEKAKARLEMLEHETRYQAQQLGEAQETLARLQMQPEAPVFDASANLELSERVSKLGADLFIAEGRVSEAEARVSAMSMEIQRHVQALREATTDVLAAKESARMEREKREEAEAKAKEAIERIAHIQEQAAQPSPLASEHACEHAQELENAQQELEKAQKAFEKARHELEEVQQELGKARHGLEKNQQEMASQKASTEALRRELEALKEKHVRAVNMQHESASQAADKEPLLQKLQEQERAVRMLQSDLCAMREERDALVFQLQARPAQQEAGVLKEASKKTQEGVAPAASDEELHRLSNYIQELESRLRQSNDETEAMREDLALRSHSVERSKHRIRELESMLANAQTQSKEDSALLGAEYDKLKQENMSLRSMLESLRAKFEEQRNEETNAHAHTAGAMLAALRKRYAEQEQVLTQTRETLERAEGELAAVHKQLRVVSQAKEGASWRGQSPAEVMEEAEYIEEIDDIVDMDSEQGK